MCQREFESFNSLPKSFGNGRVEIVRSTFGLELTLFLGDRLESRADIAKNSMQMRGEGHGLHGNVFF